MSNAVISVLHVDTPAMPRGAQLVGWLYGVISYLFSAPPARASSPLEDAAAVRRLARSVMDTDPSFAADLMAAACRHEALNG